MGLSELLLSDNLPATLSPLLPGLINEVIDMIFTLQKAEAREAKIKARKELKESDEKDSDAEDSDLTDSENDENLQDDYEDMNDDNNVRKISDNELGFAAPREENKGEDSEDYDNAYGSENDDDD